MKWHVLKESRLKKQVILKAIKCQVSDQKVRHPLKVCQVHALCWNRKNWEVCKRAGAVAMWGCEAGARSHHTDSSLVLETGQGGFLDREEVWGLETSFAQEAF